ncbi:MAG: hypothetical protein IT242_01330 [Bacteroidia bacterium]|nr:hypothetical protein [Bacteroidia bacterium]
MAGKIKIIKRFNQRYKSLSFSELMTRADEEYLEMQAEMDEQGNVVTESKFNAEGELEERNSYTWNSSGKLMSHELYYAVDDVTEHRVLTRDDKDRLISEVKYYGEDAGEKTEYSYDDKDNISEIKFYDEEGDFSAREVYSYSKNGSVSEKYRYGQDGKVTEHLTFTPGSEEKQVDETEFNPDGSVRSKTMVRFNDQGKEISSVQTTADGKLISSVATMYDDRGNVIEKKHKDFYSKTLRYEYDEADRVIVTELYDGSGLLLRKNIVSYNDDGQVLNEQTFEIDTARGGKDKHFGNRYEYELYPS